VGEVEGVLDASHDMVEVADGSDCEEVDDWVTCFLDGDVVSRTPVLLIDDQVSRIFEFQQTLELKFEIELNQNHSFNRPFRRAD
jgi:hypothetical protein